MTAPPEVDLVLVDAHRLALPFQDAAVRMLIPGGVLGTYLLCSGEQPTYVGRSDTCVLTRLVDHPLKGKATHFIVEPATTVQQAFLLEAFWYHQFGSSLTNLIHPARPKGSTTTCPFCRDDTTALKLAMAA